MLRSMINVKRYQVANTIGFLAVVAINALANILPINNLNTGQISDMYPNLFVPVPLTFGIWLVIYLGLASFILYQWGVLSGWSDDHTQVTAVIGWMFFLSCVLNVLWILAWHYLLIELSLMIMLLLFGSLLIIFNRLYYRRDPAPAEKNWVHAPFSIYFGWITVATIANVTAVLVSTGWGGFGIADAFWTVVMIAVATLITLIVLLQRRNIWFSLVVVWTLLGIYLQHNGVLDAAYPVVIYAAMVAGGLLLVMILLVLTGIVGAKARSGSIYLR